MLFNKCKQLTITNRFKISKTKLTEINYKRILGIQKLLKTLLHKFIGKLKLAKQLSHG